MKKVFALILALMLAVASLTVAVAEENIVRVGMGYDPTTLDFAEQNLDSSNFIMEATAEALIKSKGNGVYAPGLAESWTVSEDGRVWTFKLREGLVYADGKTALTAEDVYYNVKRLLDPAVGHGNVSFTIKNAQEYYEGKVAFEEVGVKVIDDLTIEYTMANPAYESSFTGTAIAGAMEQAFVESFGQTFGASAEAYLAYGPYTVSEWVADSSVTMVKNPYYYDPSVATLDKIIVVVGATGDVAVDMMLAGELDIADFANPNHIQTVVDAGFEQKTSFLESYQGLNINLKGKTEETGKFLSNVNFRKALNLAVNRDALVMSVRQGEEPATRLSHSSEAAYAYNPDYTAVPSAGDVALAKEYLNKALEELGCTIDELPTFELMCFEAQGSINTLTVYQDMWKQNLGIKTEIAALTIQVMISNAMSGNYDFWLGGNGPTVPDACESYLMGYTTANYSPLRGCSDPVFDELYNKTVASATLEERLTNYAAVEEYFCENVMSLITSWTTNYIYAPASYAGIYVADGGHLNVCSLTK
ncbi:MAG: peptide ABC transporter substrate-binding protein [Clostridia bacterium]|nr:peptide ABC transporter substrate-binding protein [Clostridia bacterium]